MTTRLSPSIPTRTQIIAALSDDTALSAIVAARIYPGKLPNAPIYPYVTVPTPSGSPQRHDASDGGSDMSGVVHCFVTPTPTAPDAEWMAATINSHVVRILEGIEVVVGGEYSLSVVPTLDQIIQDPDEADAWHGIVSYSASVT